MTFRPVAIVRPPPQSFTQCITTQKTRPDAQLARRQWEQYRQLLGQHADIVELAVDESHPDSMFVEDTVLCVRKTCFINRMGHKSRRGEEQSVKRCIESNFPAIQCFDMQSDTGEDCTLDGGDCLFTGKHVFIGLSKRTSLQAVKYVEKVLKQRQEPVECIALQVPGNSLHLKCLVTQLTPQSLLFWDCEEGRILWQLIKDQTGSDYEAVFVPSFIAANVISFPHDKQIVMQNTCAKSVEIVCQFLETSGSGYHVNSDLDMTESVKGDGLLTCQSVIIYHD